MVDEERLSFLEENAGAPENSAEAQVWPLLVVDDDADVHHATEYALRDLQFNGRSLEFLHAYGGDEAIDVLRTRPDVAVVMLDVVMGSDDAGLRTVARIRNELGLSAVRIVLRTGRPGYAPEPEAVSSYDINDYRTKAELTRSRLFAIIATAIRSYEQIRRLEESRAGLALVLDGAARFDAERGFAFFAATVITQAAALLGVPARGLICGRQPESGSALIVLAGAGGYEGLAGGPLVAGVAPALEELARGCLEALSHRRSASGMAFYVAGGRGRDYAVVIETGGPPKEIEDSLVKLFCANLAICGQNVGLVDRLRRIAYVDELTGLPNRAAQIEAIERAAGVPADSGLVLALVDIDQFSELIDTFGYPFGDQQLRAVAGRLRAGLPPGVAVARVGSDVFAVLGPSDSANPAELRRILGAPFASEFGSMTLSFSIGIAAIEARPASGADVLRDAAVALKRAKLEGPGHEISYTPEVGQSTRRRVRLLHDLRVAFESGTLYLGFQPVIEMASGRVRGVEALLRWPDGNGGFIEPEEFIPLAEHSGLIVELGDWVLRTALAARARLAAAGYALRMSVNVSPVQLHHPEFIPRLESALAAAGTAPGSLDLEITESVALHGLTLVEKRLQRIRGLGVAISIDDFGTGFSSLSYLDRLPAASLKLDHRFVRRLDQGQAGQLIIEAVIELGRRLGMRVVAEGVENERQARLLSALGCADAQGWLYAGAMPVDELLAWLAKRGK